MGNLNPHLSESRGPALLPTFPVFLPTSVVVDGGKGRETKRIGVSGGRKLEEGRVSPLRFTMENLLKVETRVPSRGRCPRRRSRPRRKRVVSGEPLMTCDRGSLGDPVLLPRRTPTPPSCCGNAGPESQSGPPDLFSPSSLGQVGALPLPSEPGEVLGSVLLPLQGHSDK